MSIETLSPIQVNQLRQGLTYLPPGQVSIANDEHLELKRRALQAATKRVPGGSSYTYLRAQTADQTYDLDQVGFDLFDKIAPIFGGLLVRREAMIEEAYLIDYEAGAHLGRHTDPYQGDGPAVRISYGLSGAGRFMAHTIGDIAFEEGGMGIIDLNKHVEHDVTATTDRLVGLWDIPVEFIK
jgi:hypothetical protein